VQEAGEARSRLARHGRTLRQGLSDAGYHVMAGESPIIPVLIGGAEDTMRASRRLFERGVFVHGVRPPTVPAGTSRLRVVPMASHSEDDIQEALAAFAEVRR
jgi:7-keto-8-aminopelargonate synthetase-like enzyme